jgi:hypothetical protein
MKHYAFLLLLICPLLVAQSPTKATVYVYRLSNYDSSFHKPSVFCDGVEIARMRNGRYFELLLTPGVHKVGSNLPDNEQTIDAKAGETYFVRVEMAPLPKGSHKAVSMGAGKVTLVAAEQGLKDASQLNPAKREDLTKDCDCDLALPKQP